MDRKFGYPLVATLLLLLFASCSSQEPDSRGAVKPNIVYILADDLGYGELGCYGQQRIETPHIDSLAQQGLRFTQHYAGAPVCAPSRCSLLTGLDMGHAYIRGNDEWKERGDVWDYAAAVENPKLEGQRPIPAGTDTVARRLQNGGYQTAIVGKWGLGAPLTEGVPTKQGFDFFFGFNCQRQAHNYYPKFLWKNEEKVWLDNDLVVPGTKLEEGADPLDPASYEKFTQKQYAPELMLEQALQFIESNKDQPFFLYYASPLPHTPLQAPKRWVDHYVEKLGDEAPYLADKGYFPNRYPHATYAAMISYLDEQVGAILDKLDELGLSNDTLVIFTSDNGPTYAGGVDPEYFRSAGPFKSGYGWAKGFVYEGGIRVPMIARWPGRVAAGTQTDLISAFYDVMPTFCEIGGLEAPTQTDGISFAPTMLQQGDQSEHHYLYWEFPSYGGQQAVRMGKWKGVRKGIFDGNMEIELYDLSNDPVEEINLAADYPEVVKEIQGIMKQEHTRSLLPTFQFPQLGD